MFYRFVGSLKRNLENPYLNILIGLIFLYSGISETVRELEAPGGLKIGAHHGVVLFSTLHVLKALPSLFGYIETVEERRRP